jgi:hypothetical protein
MNLHSVREEVGGRLISRTVNHRKDRPGRSDHSFLPDQ